VLVAELAAAPPAPTDEAVAMRRVDSTGFHGFLDALPSARGDEYLELRWRARWCLDGVEALYAAAGEAGEPLYAQFLIDAASQERFGTSHLAGTRRLAADERIVEAAYTFPEARGRGAMKAGMAQLLEVARSEGAARVWTYVGPDNVASLRGCRAVGFVPSHRRRERRRLGRFHAAELPLDDDARVHWERVTGAA
jgi:L-amino acid N-acyltransferase YncA